MAIKVTKSQEDKRIDALQGKGNGGGVGENVGNHNERFNGYTAEDGCTITGGNDYDYNHAESYKNVLNGCKYTHVGGKENSVTGADCSFVTGEKNTAAPISGSDFSWNILSGNNIRAYGVNRSILSGSGHIINNLAASIVTGIEHTIVNNNVLGGIILGAGANTAARPPRGNAYTIVVGGTSALGNVFVVSDEGDVYCRTVTQSNADYAELFEWVDGNPDNEDRRGLLVSLDGDKITLAHGDDIFGIVSANPAVICNSPQIWQGKFKRDVFDCTVRDENGEPILNPDYDPEKQYIPREQRPEWAAVGLVGRLIIVDNGTCKPNGYVSARNGIGTASLSPTNIRVLRRVDDKHVEVFIK